MIDKNKQVIDFLLQCEDIQDSPLYFNFINVQDGNIQFLTTSTDVMSNKPFIDGSVRKTYTFTLVLFKSINDISVVANKDHENLDDMNDMQMLLDWVNEQDEVRNYPNLGVDCVVEKMQTTTDNPSFDGIDESVSPAQAAYSITINIEYIDYSKVLWK